MFRGEGGGGVVVLKAFHLLPTFCQLSLDKDTYNVYNQHVPHIIFTHGVLALVAPTCAMTIVIN